MIRKNKATLLVSSFIILLPVLFGVLVWDKLPEQMPTHWGADGQVDGWSDRTFAVFVLPVFLLVTQWICVVCTAADPKNKGQNKKIFGVVLWIVPLLSLFANGMVYAAALGKEVRPHLFVNLLMGVMFIIIGNYLPKCKQNRTIGIKVKWTLENEENWNATHRFGGKVWVVGGLALFAGMLLPDMAALGVMLVSVVGLAVLPIAYSYRYHRRGVRQLESQRQD